MKLISILKIREDHWIIGSHFILVSLLAHVLLWALLPSRGVDETLERLLRLDESSSTVQSAPQQFVLVLPPQQENSAQSESAVKEQVEEKTSAAPPAVKAQRRPARRRRERRERREVKRRPLPPTAPAKVPVPSAAVAENHSEERPSPVPSVEGRASAAAEVAARSSAAQPSAASEATPAQPRALSARKIRGLQQRYYMSLSRFLKRGYPYPLSARRQRLEGTVMVELRIDNEGRLLSVKVLRSSGHESLDQAALAQVARLERVPAPPRDLRWRERTVHIPFSYSLRES